MSTSTTNTIRPIIDQHRGWRQWHYNELYLPGETQGQYVPNVDDAVLDWSSNTIYRVISVNYSNNTFTLQATNLGKFTGYSTGDILTTSGPGDVSEAYRIYFNTEIIPHTMTFDSRVRMFGTQAAYVKVFRGTDITVNGNVVSAMFNTSGVKTSENIPLELVLIPTQENVGMKTPVTGYATDTINDGEILTVVTYTADGDVSSISRMVGVNTNVVRTINQEERYITNIDLVSPYLSASDTTLLEYPLNMVIQSDSMQGRVSYSNGESALLPIDGTKFQLLGMDSFIASEVGQVFALKLVYTLSNGEYATGVSNPLPDRSLMRTYRVQTVESDDTYVVKLFVVPTWNNVTNMWTLNYYLYHIERNDIIDVTPYVEVGSQSAPFVGNNYDAPQNLVVSLNMLSLGSSYKYFRHPQAFTIQLYNPGSSNLVENYWYVRYTNDTMYGQGLFARVTADPEVAGLWRVDVANNFSVVSEWLDRFYRSLSPLYYTKSETQAPDPTHVRIRIGNTWSREVPISEILQPITGVNAPITQGQPVRLEFFARTTVRDMELALAALTIRV